MSKFAFMNGRLTNPAPPLTRIEYFEEIVSGNSPSLNFLTAITDPKGFKSRYDRRDEGKSVNIDKTPYDISRVVDMDGKQKIYMRRRGAMPAVPFSVVKGS